MNGREVFKFAVRQMGNLLLMYLKIAGLTKEDVAHFFLCSSSSEYSVLWKQHDERLELPEEKMSKTIHKYGNTSAAIDSISIGEEFEDGKIKDDDLIVLLALEAA